MNRKLTVMLTLMLTVMLERLDDNGYSIDKENDNVHKGESFQVILEFKISRLTSASN